MSAGLEASDARGTHSPPWVGRLATLHPLPSVTPKPSPSSREVAPIVRRFVHTAVAHGVGR